MKNTVQNTASTAVKYCFSYVRFSSDGQRDGTSVQRQSDAIEEALKEHPEWSYRNDWNIGTTTEGVSAYKMHNFPVLHAVIDAAKDGRISGVMLIEQINRLTRADMDEALPLVISILKSGIEIYNCKTKKLYSAANLKNITDLILLIVDLDEANKYAAQISHNVSKAWKIQRQRMLNGEVILKTKKGEARKVFPEWIENTGTRLETNEKAALIAAIFKFYLEGKGPAAIAREFNLKGVSSLRGGKWSQSIIYRLLSDRRLIGEVKVKQETVKGYYPQVIDEETFLRVQAKMADNRGKPIAKQGEKAIVNLFSGVAVCRCGSAIKVTNGNAGQYMTCQNRLKGLGCEDASTKYQPFESAFTMVLKFNPAQLLRDEEGQSGNVQLQILNGRLAETQKQIDNITGFILKGIATEAMAKAQMDLEAQAKEIKAQIALEAAKKVAVVGGFERLSEILFNLHNLKNDQAFRMKVQGWIRENINRIEIDRNAKTFTVDLKSGNCLTLDFCGNIRGSKSLASIVNLNAAPMAIAAAQ